MSNSKVRPWVDKFKVHLDPLSSGQNVEHNLSSIHALYEEFVQECFQVFCKEYRQNTQGKFSATHLRMSLVKKHKTIRAAVLNATHKLYAVSSLIKQMVPSDYLYEFPEINATRIIKYVCDEYLKIESSNSYLAEHQAQEIGVKANYIYNMFHEFDVTLEISVERDVYYDFKHAVGKIADRKQSISPKKFDNLPQKEDDMSFQYTFRERTIKSQTVGAAVSQAKKILFDKHNIKSCCVTAVRDRELDEAITIVEMDELVSKIVDDTLFYN